MPERAMGVVEVLAAAGGGGVITKVVDAIMRGRTLRKDEMTAVAEAAELLMGGMRQDLKAIRERLDEVEQKHLECEERCDAQANEIAALRAARRDDRQMIESLVRQLKDPASTQPGGSLDGAVIAMSGGEVTVTHPARNRRTRAK